MFFESQLVYRIADALLRHRKLFLISFLVVTLLPASVLLRRPKTYTATASVQVVPSDVASTIGISAGPQVWISPAQQQMNRFNDYLNDDSPQGFLNEALAGANLRNPIRIDPRASDPRRDLLRKNLNVSTASDTVFQINLVWQDPDECERIVNSLQHQFIEQTGINRQNESAAAARFLDEEIASYKLRMQVAEQAVRNFKKDNFGKLADAQTNAQNELSTLQTQLDELQTTAKDDQIKRASLAKLLAQEKPTSILKQTLGDSPDVQHLKDLQAKRSQLLDEWLPTSSVVRDVDRQIDEVTKSIAAAAKVHPAIPGQTDVTSTEVQNNPEYQREAEELTNLDADIASTQSDTARLKDLIKEYNAHLQKMPAAESALTERNRDYTNLQTQYNLIWQRREDTELKANLDKRIGEQIMRPLGTIYAQPTTNKTKTMIMIAGLGIVGLLIGCIMVTLSEWIDPSLRYSSDAERLCNLPMLAAIPDIRALDVTIKHVKGSGGGRGLLGRGKAEPQRAKLNAPVVE